MADAAERLPGSPRNDSLRKRHGHRLYGEPAEAGRWMYLEADRDPVETSAFEERRPTPPQRMRALAWHGQESLAGTAFAARQLAAVRKAASDHLGRPVTWVSIHSVRHDGSEELESEANSFTDRLAGVGVALLVLGFFAVWVLGFVTFVRWLWP
ncbi:MAG TPA: DUF6584 family protein [Streptomyces sp.]|nr:DUF6584 family protein [Streptomyces sp.]